MKRSKENSREEQDDTWLRTRVMLLISTPEIVQRTTWSRNLWRCQKLTEMESTRTVVSSTPLSSSQSRADQLNSKLMLRILYSLFVNESHVHSHICQFWISNLFAKTTVSGCPMRGRCRKFGHQTETESAVQALYNGVLACNTQIEVHLRQRNWTNERTTWPNQMDDAPSN